MDGTTNWFEAYAERFGDKVANHHGIQITGSTLSMDFFSLLFGVNTADEFKTEFADELADETHLAKKGAKEEL